MSDDQVMVIDDQANVFAGVLVALYYDSACQATVRLDDAATRRLVAALQRVLAARGRRARKFAKLQRKKTS